MSKSISWDEVESPSKIGGNKKGDGTGGKYMKLVGSLQGTTYRVRPVGDPCTFYAYYVQSPDDPKRFNRAITEDPKNCIIAQKYNLEAKPRYAVNVIDRADGRLKIMEAPATVLDAIKTWAKASKQHPGGKGGADFEITVKIPANNDRKRTEYKTTPVVQTPWTDEESAMLKEKGLYKLETEFAPVPQAEIESKLFGPKTAPSAPATPAATAAPAAKATNSAADLGF